MSTVLQAIDFTNHLGHVIKPGDKVIAVTTGYSHTVTIREAEYIGCRVTSNHRGARVESVTVRTLFKGSRYNSATRKYEQYEKVRRTTLPACRIYPLKDA